MDSICLRPAQVERDFEQLAAWFSLMERDATSTEALEKDYAAHQARIICLTVAEDAEGQLLGFNWATRALPEPERATVYLFVAPEHRRQGVGRRLYADVLQAAEAAEVRKLRISIDDSCAEGLDFAQRRGFSPRGHTLAMLLDLATFDDQPYQALIARLKGEGYQFTSMEALGNTEAAQHKLFVLNDTAASETPGSNDEHAWSSFEDFQTSVCQSNWYKPAGQMVVIAPDSGEWVAMSAITRMEGNDYAYNLFTGVDKRYRGRKLAQAVKVLALCYARDVLQVGSVRTHHNALNDPMLAIDRKLGYQPAPGYYSMEKVLG